MAKNFDNPKKLGFLRLLQVLFAFNIVFTVALLVFLVKGNYELGFTDYLDFLNLIFNGIGFWLIWQRKRSTRIFIIVFCLFNIIVGTIANLAFGTFNLGGQVYSSAVDIFLIVYFFHSRRVKAMLTEPLSMETKDETLKKDMDFYQPKTWAFWRNLIIYFCVFSVVGHWMEAGYCTLIRFGLLPGTYDPNSQIWSDWFYPFVVYGVGAVACVLLLFPVKNFLQKKIKGQLLPLFLSFIVNAIVCTLIELAMGLMLNQPLPNGTLPLWDYSNMFGNFMGQICLQNAIAFGVAGTFMTWVVYPGLETLIEKVPRDIMNITFISVVVGFTILFFLYCINVTIPEFNETQIEAEQAQALGDAANATSTQSSQ